MKQIDKDKNMIIYNDDKLSYRKIIYGEYSETADITFIMQDIIERATENALVQKLLVFIMECLKSSI